MASLGSYLRELRQRRGASIDEVSRATRVASQYLHSLEADDHTDLPAPVFTRGFIRAYCQFLGEPPDEALARYAGRTAEGADPTAAVNGPPAPAPVVAAAPTASAPAEREARGRGAVLVSFVLLIVLGLALFAVTLALNTGRDGAAHRQSAGGTGAESPVSRPSAVEAPASVGGTPPAPAPARPTPLPDPRGSTAARTPGTDRSVPSAAVASRSPAPDTPAARPGSEKAPPATAEKIVANVPAAMLQPFVGSVTSPYRLVARATEPTWIRVRTQDGRSIEETVPAGETREWLSNAPFVLTVGNAGGVVLELNGRALPPLGGHGVVIQRLVLPPPQQ
jgi:cytoskeleton protein RodZ